jgi:hypothetical protein
MNGSLANPLGTDCENVGPERGRLLRILWGGGSGLGRIWFVGAFDVNGGHLCTHGAQISGELAAVMDRVADSDVEVGDGWIIAQADEVNARGQAFAGERLHERDALREVLLIPLGDA